MAGKGNILEGDHGPTCFNYKIQKQLPYLMVRFGLQFVSQGPGASATAGRSELLQRTMQLNN